MHQADLFLDFLALLLTALAAWTVIRLMRSSEETPQTAGLGDDAALIVDNGRIVGMAREAQSLLGPVLGEPVKRVMAGYLGEENGAIGALDRLERTGEPVRLLTEDRSGHLVELAGRPAGAQLRIVLRDASLLEERLAEAERKLAERTSGTATETLVHDTLSGLVGTAPLAVWNRSRDSGLRWSGGAVPAPGGAVSAERIATAVAARSRRDRETGAAGPTKMRLEIPGAEGGESLALHVVETSGPDGAVFGFAVDASSANAAERTLTRFVQTMTETFAHLTVGLAIFDGNQTLALFNPALVDMWNVDPAWLARRPSLREVIETLRASRRIPEFDDFHAWRRRLLGLFADTERVDYEEVWHLADGTSIRVLARPHPHGSLAFVFDDVTERMRLEQQFRHLIDLRRATLDRMDEGIAVFGPDGMLRFVNTAFHEIWGTDDRALANCHAREVVHLCSAASVEAEVWDRLMSFVTADASRQPWSTRLTLASGRILSLRVASLPDSSSLVVFLDITAAERIAQALRERNEALEAAEELRTAVLDQISHRLRIPLNVIFGFAQLIGDRRFGELSERQAEFIDSILEAAGELHDKIDDVTELASLQIEPLQEEGAPQRVWDTLETAHSLLLKRAIEGGVITMVDEPPPDAAGLSCDVPNLRQLVFTMVADALHRASRGRRIRIGARADGDTLEIRTVETGGETGAEPPQAEFGNLTRSLLRRMMARCHGSFELVEHEGEVHAVCRFPGALSPADAEEAGPVPDEPPELDLPLD